MGSIHAFLFGFLCCGEFTASGVGQYSDTDLRCMDVVFSEDSIFVHLQGFKTDPFRKGHIISISPSGRSVCAVHALQWFLRIRSGLPQEPFFGLSMVSTSLRPLPRVVSGPSFKVLGFRNQYMLVRASALVQQ